MTRERILEIAEVRGVPVTFTGGPGAVAEERERINFVLHVHTRARENGDRSRGDACREWFSDAARVAAAFEPAVMTGISMTARRTDYGAIAVGRIGMLVS